MRAQRIQLGITGPQKSLKARGELMRQRNPSMQPLCLSSVATELGLRFSSENLKAIGKQFKAAYVAAYNESTSSSWTGLHT
jgi:hypothetical protein